MTTASSHLSKDLKELIKSIGETKSKQEEDKIILSELALLKPSLLEKSISPKKLKELLIRALYIEMLGHSASFAHIHAINLTQNKNLILKRIGYLMCSIFFTKDSDLLIMLVSTIQKDLQSQDINEIIICLTSLGALMNETIAEGIADSVGKLTTHQTDLVRKKALLVLQAIKSQTNVQVPDFKEKLKKGLCDREPNVMAVSLNLYCDEIKENPRKYREMAASFVIILKQVIEHKLPKEFDYHRMPAPWVQLKLMKILELVGKGDKKASEHCYTILEQALKRADETSNSISFAISYQCIKTIFSIYPHPPLLEMATESLSKFLAPSSNNNLKHMGLRLLSLAHKEHPDILASYQLTIVECLQSRDETLKQETLELLYRMTNPGNIETIVSKMMNTLHSSTDQHFRNSLVLKIVDLCERFSPTHKWYLDTMMALFELGSEYLNRNVLNGFLRLVVETCEGQTDIAADSGEESFQHEIVQKMVELLEKNSTPTDFIVKASVWILGEIGSISYANQPEKLAQLFSTVNSSLSLDTESTETTTWILDSVLKLSSAQGFPNHNEVKLLLTKYITNSSILIYNRALEGKKLAKYNTALKKSHEVNFDEDLGFLEGFVSNARMTGAKEYNKEKYYYQSNEEESNPKLRFKQYVATTKKNALNSPFDPNSEHSKEKQPIQQQLPVVPEPLKEEKPVKPVVIPPSKPVQKKKFITPQEKAKMKVAQNLFGGGASSQQPKPKPSGTGPQSGKKKVPETMDLI